MKNTALVKTLGGGVKEYSFNSKKIVLSLATISFLASYANASGTSDACPTNNQARSGSTSSNNNYTISSNCSGITLSNSGTSTLTIESSGTIEASNYSSSSNSYAITLKGSNGNTPTLEKLTNEGTIKGKIGIENNNGSFSGTITVRTFENKNTIDGHIYMGLYHGSGGTISIETFNNEGTITNHTTSPNNDGAIYFEGTTRIKTFKNTGTIDGKGKNSISLKAQNNQTPTLENFINEGTIKGRMVIENRGQNGQSFQGTITVKTFENKNNGIIDGDIYIGMWGGSTGTISIENFKNSGTIKGGSRQGVYFEDIRSAIKTFENTGFISGSGDNSIAGGLHTGGGVVMSGGTIETFKNSGTIKSTGTDSHYSSGVKLHYATVKTFENTNTGLISGLFGFITTQGTIETFINKGIIESKGNGHDGNEAAIRIQTAGQNGISTINHLINEGTIKSDSHNGILIESGNKIGTIINKGTIETKLNGISFFDYGPGSSPDNTELGKIILEKDSSIKAGKNGIDIDVKTTKTIKADGIEVKKGASVSGGEAGIYLAKGDEIKAPITVSGTVSGGNAGIVNEGSISAPITISGTVSGGNAGIVNESEGKMAKGIINDGEAELVISNQGLVEENNDGNTVANNGSGSVRIKEWVVTTNEATGKLRTVHVGGKNTANVKVNSITVDQSGLDINELNDITNIISGVSTNNIADSVKTNGGGEISLSYDPISARLSTDVQLNASIAGANFRSSVATASKRATFIDNVMANAMQSFSLDSSGKSQKIALSEKGNLYADASDYIKNDYIKNDYIKSDLTQANYGLNKEHALFILPYLSSQSVELSLNEESKGHTKGTIIGYSTLKDSGIYGVYAGYEDTKMDSTYFDVNNISYYTGLKYFNTLFTTAKGQEVYIKAQAQAALIKNDFTKRIGKNEAKAKAHSYTYGIHTALGMNFIADKNIFSPEAGFAYEGSYTEAFSMQDTRGQATVRGGERTYANHLNLFSTKTSFTWFRDWLPYLKTSVELGAKFNVNPKVKARARFGNMKVNDEFHLPRVRKFASTSLIVPVNEAFYFSLNYNGMFDEKGNTHTGFAQFNYLW
ncbi:autotransporter beta-domain-containing protein [Campylobacter jejuni subsp. doylei]|nr:autotransporter beta-domain-containing protein [Campylobacter jejuni subsp. doylei]